jgi:hypothetical protein
MPSFSTNLIDTEIVQQGAKDEDLDFYLDSKKWL